MNSSSHDGNDTADRATPATESATTPTLTAVGSLTRGLRSLTEIEPTPEQHEAIENLLPTGPAMREYIARFSSLTVLSAAIASFGLLSDSSAVVIGAMLVAPLMTPITAAASATVTARNVRLVWSLAVIVLGTVLAIFVGWFVALVAGFDVQTGADLTDEVRSRTFPGLLDLGVAITAGAAAGYILPRQSATSALPGVGIAVALVPPLAVVGIAAEASLYLEARNALLLYLTNLAAIIFSVAIMLLLVGFRPTAEQSGAKLRTRLLVTLTAVAMVAIPLTLHTRTTIRDLRLQRAVTDSVSAWDENTRVVEVTADVVDGLAKVELLVAGQGTPRPAWQLAEEIRERFDGPVDLRLLFEQDVLFETSAR